jgi:ABC-type multidrug transport system permease subunit
MPPRNTFCEAYLGAYQRYSGAIIVGIDANGVWICPFSSTNSLLVSLGSKYGERWRNLGIFVAFIYFDVTVTFLLYLLVRSQTRES